MPRPFLRIVLTAACFCAFLTPAYPLGIRILNQDPQGVARGGAFTATADNPSAIYYNPAGITQLDGQQVQIGAYGIVFDVKHRSAADDVEYDTPDRLQAVPQLFYTCKIPDVRLSFGVGIYSPYGFGTEWQDNSSFRSLATKNQLVFLSINPVLAWKITDTLSIAAGPTIDYSQVDLRRGIFVSGDQFRFKGDGVGYGFTAGLLWQPVPQHSFGVSYRSQGEINYDGHATVTSNTPFFFPSSREDATLKFYFPQHVTLGYSFRPSKEWNFEVDVDWTDWDYVEKVTLKKKSGNVPETFGWESGFTIMTGATRYFSHGLALSAGYFYSPSATPDANYHVSVPDVDLHVFSVGIDYRVNRWRVGLSYNLGYGPETTVQGSAPTLVGETADGKYKFLGHGISLAAGYQF